MKKTIFFLAAVAMAGAFTACEKAAALLFKPFESPLSFSINIDPVVQGFQGTMGSSTVSYNLDGEVRAATGNAFGGDFIKQMYVQEIAMSLSNADADNNLGNFEGFSVVLTSGTATPVVLGPFAIPASTTNSFSVKVTDSPNIRQFFNGNNVDFTVVGMARKTTTKQLNANVSATLKFDK